MSDRDCEKCKHHTEKGCDSWDCEFEQEIKTREDAIKRLKLWLICSEEYSEKDVSMNDAIRVAINSLEIDERYELEYEQIEPCEDVAKECYEDLCEYFGGAKNILKNREDFKAWLGRVRWHIHKVDELSAENDDLRDQLAMRDRFQKQELCEDAISREELLKAIDTWDKFGYTETGYFVREPKGDYVPYIHYDDVIRCIKGMPSVKPQEPKTDILDKIRDEIDRQEKWLLKAGYTAYNVDIAFDAIRSALTESEGKNENGYPL